MRQGKEGLDQLNATKGRTELPYIPQHPDTDQSIEEKERKKGAVRSWVHFETSSQQENKSSES